MLNVHKYVRLECACVHLTTFASVTILLRVKYSQCQAHLPMYSRHDDIPADTTHRPANNLDLEKDPKTREIPTQPT